MQSYDLPQFQLIHADFYRLSAPSELTELGFDALPEGAVVLLEWPDRAAGILRPWFYTNPHTEPSRLRCWLEARGLQHQSGWERIYRDAPLLLIGEGTSEIQRMVIGKKLLQRHKI